MPRGFATSLFSLLRTVLLGVAAQPGWPLSHSGILEFMDRHHHSLGEIKPVIPLPRHFTCVLSRRHRRHYLFSSQISFCALVCSPVTSRSPKASHPHVQGYSGSTFRLSYRPLES
ncbi:uncharacterized protein BO96DRAFT_261883 [Aspergillus niger CBS 101883]|uniref:Secreted protein n=2 Tax=Aspergillus TaxID=5052 RepID=A0A370P3N2_ASPPH|nr:uncharacterized protein BO96DRAFT_261883 [Aspergillus niger CBS 101883]PYH57604.1 hypothetical protein BO96DRAFT_261883 [Aspergillus niger CBS 101883]RDH23909.1 hypothetical protein M747DRAFT_134838 [Aspergillus niger ATCC 13496]RDK36430.1 hypothetical protein M752DRAFT_280474 [Aspergillus phoenicis ATCC 13157]